MKQIRIYLALLCTMLLAVGCTKEMDTEITKPNDAASLIKIGDFPAFDEGAQTRAVGTPDPGKTAWEDKDEVLLYLKSKGSSYSSYKIQFTYNANTATWTTEDKVLIELEDYRDAIFDVSAYYAPNCKIDSSEKPVIMNQSLAGLNEYLAYTQKGVSISGGITINFAQARRNYSRLRIVTDSDAALTVTTTGFTPAGMSASQNFSTSTNADAKGNTFLYGSWTADATFKVVKSGSTIIDKTIAEESSSNIGYVMAAGYEYDDYGEGTAEDPYLIYTATQLATMSSVPKDDESCIFYNKHIKLMCDIDCSSLENDFQPIGGNKGKTFAGNFDGGGFTISNLMLMAVTGEKDSYSGLFGLCAGVTIKNLILKDPKLTSNGGDQADYIGALIGQNDSGVLTGGARFSTITNCHVISDVEFTSKRSHIGGLIGSGNYVTMEDCSTSLPINCGGKFAGGLMGEGQKTTLNRCYAKGAVTAAGSGEKSIGGLIGKPLYATIVGSYFSGTLSSTNVGLTYMGGLVGNTGGDVTIVGSYATCAISSTHDASNTYFSYLGGLVGRTEKTTVLSSYFSGSIMEGTYQGAFLGYNNKVFNLYYSASIGNWGSENGGVGTAHGSATSDVIGAKFDTPAADIRKAIVNLEAEVKWRTDEAFTKARTAMGDKNLDAIWEKTPDGAPKLWWE